MSPVVIFAKCLFASSRKTFEISRLRLFAWAQLYSINVGVFGLYSVSVGGVVWICLSCMYRK